MGWMVNFYHHEIQIWTDRRKYAEDQKHHGAAAYATRKIAMYENMASLDEGRFKAVNANYKADGY
jgi:hypothetical protein